MADPFRPIRDLPGELRHVARPAGSEVHKHLRDRLFVLGFLTAVLWAICTVLMYFFERHAKGTDIHNGWQAAYWTASQMTAIGSTFANPRSTPAYVLDMLLKLYDVVIVAALAGAMGAFFIHRHAEEKAS